jgi:hypothetical protein
MSNEVKKFWEKEVGKLDLRQLLMDMPIVVERDDYTNGYRLTEVTTLRKMEDGGTPEDQTS